MDSGDRPGSEESVSFPAALVTDDSSSRGTLPFSWRSNGSVADGQWWLDPAWSFNTRFDFPGESDDFSLDYCFNPYFDIDLRGTEACP
ncbi:MAG: hypothetical protein AAFS10_21300 [Myxococcota bacterium]